VAKAEAIYMQAVERVAETAVNARSEVREAYEGYRSAYDIARHYRDEVVPLRQAHYRRVLLRYNGMLIGVFELLADARAQVASVNGRRSRRCATSGWPRPISTWRCSASRSRRSCLQSRTARPKPAVATEQDTLMTTATQLSRRRGHLRPPPATVSRAALAALPEPVIQTSADTQRR
jgi:hypothetical protein